MEFGDELLFSDFGKMFFEFFSPIHTARGANCINTSGTRLSDKEPMLTEFTNQNNVNQNTKMSHHLEMMEVLMWTTTPTQ